MNAELITALLVIGGAFLALLRAVKGPTTFDRVLAVNVFGTKTVVLLALLGYIGDRTGFLDIAVLYALVNFLGTIALLKFVETRRLG
ncbi:MAG: cation:proton antiporter [Planctomycetia bacterium]|nr:cation:proton antiporter [Planctomycetia bacterium]MBL6913774.1 cation:proton antiporter [Planctomycetota bacterium]MDG2084391.1 monovalent cation/H+ antiporter complex subunit F [Planctomycetota bacterium]NCF56344.1 cation:proton antiporter [Planctomycetia bacterium]NCF98686.1 cation:proton antiporter [Planctomycetia bacterium]